ncbi:ATP synthase F0 sector subunit b [Labilithrix luteola]|uniref:ATP synthase subunit b n=1 Tax=Labilithrix luteola TaxID=1391654 RepID=A0A0K1PKJ4_9BACT|nr:hypothetical protein [Labilithrix luteola]AKU94058.1 ATP synthase F0 sector subunit b [Labilithrix luteola]
MKIKQKLVYAGLLASAFTFATAIAVAQEHGEGHGEAPAPAAQGHEGAAPAGHEPADHEAAGGHEAAAHGEHGGHHGPESINWFDFGDKKKPAFLALVINFGVLAGLYYVIGKKPITEGLKQRRVTIGKNIEEAQAMLAEAKERAKKYQGDLANADADAEAARAALVASGTGDADRALRDAEEKAVRMKRDAERLVEQERRQLQQDLTVETVELAVAEANKILERSVTADDHARLANDLLAELSRRPAARSSVGGAS